MSVVDDIPIHCKVIAEVEASAEENTARSFQSSDDSNDGGGYISRRNM